MLHKECINDPTDKMEFIIVELRKNGLNNATVVYTDYDDTFQNIIHLNNRTVIKLFRDKRLIIKNTGETELNIKVY